MFISGIGKPNPGMDPDSYARIYAQQNGISFEEAKNQLRAKFGDPKPPSLFDEKQINLER